jgi:hypothetical protein
MNLWSQPLARQTIVNSAIGIGALSIACGVGMLVAPRLFATMFSLPRERGLIRVLGARDVLIGSALAFPRTRSLGLRLRSVADMGDGLLIAREVRLGHTGAIRGVFSLLVAAGSAAFATRLGKGTLPAQLAPAA